jgi:NADH-quinone oxidoreductase subunit K
MLLRVIILYINSTILFFDSFYMVFFHFFVNVFLFSSSLIGISLNRRNFLIILMCIELILLSINLNFALFSNYLDDFYGQLFFLFILTIAAAESAIGLALIIIYYKFKKNILISQKQVLRF